MIVLSVFTCFSSPRASAEERIDCLAGEGKAERKLSGFLIQVSPAPDKNIDRGLCRAIIRTAEGKIVFQVRDHSITINDATGGPISGDGKPDLVIEGDSGGAHCCSTYWIVSLENPPTLLRTIYNEVPVWFRDLNEDGRLEILTYDGAFDYFDGMSHSHSPFPLVVLRLNGRQLDRVNAEYWHLYEKEISEARSKLSGECAKLFRLGQSHFNGNDRGCDWEETKKQILIVVLDNLYGGHEGEAWKILAEDWPPGDLMRIRKLILDTANKSFLGDTRRASFGGNEWPSKDPRSEKR